jgi:putative flippase GtrA
VNRIKYFLDQIWFRFLVIGGFSAILEIVLLVLLVEWIGLGYLLSNSIAFLVVNMINFLLSKYWVFETGNRKKGIEIGLFYFVVLVGLALNQAVMFILVEFMTFDYKISKVAAILLTVIWNYFGKKNLVFKVK